MQTTETPYIYKRDSTFYFSRRVPKDLVGHYMYPRIVISSRIKSFKAATTKSSTLSAQLDEEWLTLRWRTDSSPLRKYRIERERKLIETSDAPLMSEAKSIYLLAKGEGRPITFQQGVDRAVNNLISVI
jgi:hypothetical protein